MSLHHRLKRLEARMGPPPVGRCGSCGVPRGWMPMWDVVGADGASAMPGCPGCGHPLEVPGRPVPALPAGRGQKQYGPATAWEAV